MKLSISERLLQMCKIKQLKNGYFSNIMKQQEQVEDSESRKLFQLLIVRS